MYDQNSGVLNTLFVGLIINLSALMLLTWLGAWLDESFPGNGIGIIAVLIIFLVIPGANLLWFRSKGYEPKYKPVFLTNIIAVLFIGGGAFVFLIT